MKNVLLILTTLLLTSKFIYSQETYPKTIKLGNDTVVVLLPNQINKINVVWEHKRFLESENSILNNTLNQYTILSHEKDSIIAEIKKTISEVDAEISKQNNINNDLRKENKELNIHLTKTKKNRKMWLFGGFGVGILTMILIN